MKLRSIVVVNVLVLAGVVAFAAIPGSPFHTSKKTALPDLMEGDILFQTMDGGQTDAIALATQCKWTHVGIAFKDAGQWVVYEAVGPVKKTLLADWIEQGNGHYVVKRLDAGTTKLDEAGVNKLRDAAMPYMGRAYDWQFLWSDDRIYCSELVWKMYEDGLGLHLCEPKPLREYKLDSDLVQRTMQERYGQQLPMDEPMVAPSTLFNCAMLVTVVEK
ncbi:MAG TPA: YiiX/YebB-like N1pC/P60 family cysteine hydrolase [Flavobacteriales bacterium]|nr:YiiX/YebB-like N1pC/P60 family cysteine hydrolase [Flavobacteriales bacterium]